MRSLTLAFLLGLFCLTTPRIFAQTETGQISGTVLDASGGSVAKATVTVRGVDTGTTRTTTSNDSGVYTVGSLLPGNYTVTVTAPGFATSQNRITVAAGSHAGMDFHLEVGKTETVVQVTESAVQVNTENQSLNSLITESSIKELPTLTRNPYSLVATAGNVSEGGPGTRGAGYSINGQRESSTNILLDGASNNDEFSGNIGQQVPLDSVQEINVMTSNYTAEFGRASGGIVNVVTKNGTNDFHGTAYEFNRVSALSSNTYDNNANSQDKGIYTRNQFGYSIGGPVKRNKLFFFNNTEWIRVRSGAQVSLDIPTSQLLAASAPNTQAFFSKYGQLRSGASVLQTITKDQYLASTGKDICAGGKLGICAALPGSTPMFQKIGFTTPTDAGGGFPQNTYMTDARVDFNVSERTQIYGRYALYSELDFDGTLSNSPYSGFDLGQTIHNQNILFSAIHTFSPRFVSQSKLVFNRLSNDQPLSNGIAPTMYANPNGAVTVLGTNVAFPGYYPTTPGNGGEFHGPQNYAQLYEDLSYNFGKHNLRFGGTYNYQRDNRTYGAFETAVASLSATNSLGNSLDNLLHGFYDSYQVAVDPQGKFPCSGTVTPACSVTLPLSAPTFSRSNRYNDFAFYGQDSWKVSPRLTLNLGLRWEYFGVQHNKNSNLDANYYNPNGPNGGTDNTAASLIDYVKNGQFFTVPNSPTHQLWAKDLNNFAPRVGFAWDVFGTGTTSVRGGYGIGYERNFGNVTFNIIQNPPNYAVLGITTANDGILLPISNENLGPLAGNSGTKALPKVTGRVVDPNIKTAYAHMWSAAVEHQFSANVVASIEYTGSKGEDLYTIGYINRAGYGNLYNGVPCTAGGPGDPGNCTTLLRTTQYGKIGFRGNQGFSNYHGMNGKLTLRDIAHSGLSLITNYTWSHAIDNQSSTFFEAGTAGLFNNNITNNNGLNIQGLLDPFNPGLDRGNAEFDLRQRVAISGVWDVPFHGKGAAAKVLGGWSLAPILTIRSGSPFSIFDGTNSFTYNPRAEFSTSLPRTGGNGVVPVAGTPNQFQYLSWNPSQVINYFNPKYGISDLPPFPSGMTGRDAFTGPGFWNVDFGVYKNTKLTERFNLQLRGEAYNLMNHANLYVIGASADVSASNYVSACKGCTGGTSDHRNLQLAAKLIF